MKLANENRFSGKIKKTHFFLVVVILVFILTFFLLYANHYSFSNIFSARVPSRELIANWNRKDYKTVYNLSNAYLSQNPVNTDVLMFKGFSAYYLGMAQIEEESKNTYIDECIFSLRNILDNHIPEYTGHICYILGKAYYQKGVFYADLASSFFEQAYQSELVAEDLAEYRGLTFALLGDYESSLVCFTEALVESPTDLLLFSIALDYYNVGNIELAAQYFLQVFDTSDDDIILQKAQQMIADIYIQKGEWELAEKEYNAILEKNPESADAQYGLGLVYEGLGDSVKARAAWRKALKIDPLHKLTRDKLETK